MATKTFSSRADAQKLSYADAVTRKKFGMSFGQYCGSLLIDAVCLGADLPQPASTNERERKASAIARIKAIHENPHDEKIGRMTDEQIENMIASRYE